MTSLIRALVDMMHFRRIADVFVYIIDQKKSDLLGRMRKSLRNNPGLLIQMRRKQKAQQDKKQDKNDGNTHNGVVNDEEPAVPPHASVDSESADFPE